jgi:hypothetical protein
MIRHGLSVIIVAGKEEDVIADCVKSAMFADEMILVTSPTCTAQTVKLARLANPKIKIVSVLEPGIDFSAWHNIGSRTASSEWLLHLDCDERITPSLRDEIISKINDVKSGYTNYDIPRANYFLGKRVKHGGTYPDYVKRLYLKSNFIVYHGSLHEQPKITGSSGIIQSDLIHFTHRRLSSMLDKSNSWTAVEAHMLYENGHPPIVWWRFFRMMVTKLWQRLIIQQMWRDGTVGWISAIFEGFDTFMIYARLWELQQKND